MKKMLAVLFLASFATGLLAQGRTEKETPSSDVLQAEAAGHHHFFLPKGVQRLTPKVGGQNLVYHSGGPVILSAKVVDIFWGSFPSGYASTLQAFRTQFGQTAEFNVITQYYQNLGSGNQFIQLTNLGSGTADWFDTSTPPTNVTDADVQAEVLRYLSTHSLTPDDSTIYEVFIPSTSYSSSGSSTSCGGPNLAYCAYHGDFSNSGHVIKYSIEPYPSCSGCSLSGWSDVQNQEHFVCHETRESVTDQQLNAWFDHRGNEADDKCAWSPTPFLVNGYGYQYEWSNAVGGCVQTR
jgi:hypothetical protein